MSQDRTQTATSPPHPLATEALYRARVADLTVIRPARRTLQQMAPGMVRQPVLRLVPQTTANDVPCLYCDRWTCPGDCQGYAPVPTAVKAAA